ncbi:MAG: acyltransferase family protein [Chloroflexota bacterium]
MKDEDINTQSDMRHKQRDSSAQGSAIEQDIQASQSDFLNQFFAPNEAVASPTQLETKLPEPSMLQPEPQVEFTPLQETNPSLKPDILQPNAQAEFKEKPILSVPQIEISSELNPQPAAQPRTALPKQVDEPAAQFEYRPPRQKIEFLQIVRALALLLVVFEWVSAPAVTRLGDIESSAWWSAVTFYMHSKVGIPLFLMASGYLALNPEKQEAWSAFLSKRFRNVLIPFFAWLAAYTVWQVVWVGGDVSSIDSLLLLWNRPVFYHLWLLQVLLTCYAITPIIKIYAPQILEDNMIYLIGGWAAAVAILPIVNAFFDVEFSLDVFITLELIGFFFLGHYLRPFQLDYNQRLAALGTIVITSLGSQYLIYQMTFEAGGTFVDTLAQFGSLNSILIAAAIFLFAKSVDYEQVYMRYPGFYDVIQRVGQAGFGIYLLHVLILAELSSGRLGMEIGILTAHPLMAAPLLTFGTIAILTVTVLRLQQIPFLKNLLP